MKSIIVILLLVLSMGTFAGTASAKTSCGDLKANIEAKLQSKGAKAFTLKIIGKDEATDLRVVGTCDGGAKKIVYKRGQ